MRPELAALDSSTGLFALGGALTTLDSPGDEYLFGWSQQSWDVRLRVTTIPEPLSTALFGICLLGVWMRRRG
jgi:hypothetical protein